MKKYLPLLSLCSVLVAGCTCALAQNTPSAAEIAARQEAEERYKRLTATVEDLKEALVAQQKTIASLREEVRQLREENSRVSNNPVGQDTVRRLAEKIQEVDRKRDSDNKLIQETLAKLQKSLTTPTMPATKIAKADTPPAMPATSDKAIEYT